MTQAKKYNALAIAALVLSLYNLFLVICIFCNLGDYIFLSKGLGIYNLACSAALILGGVGILANKRKVVIASGIVTMFAVFLNLFLSLYSGYSGIQLYLTLLSGITSIFAIYLTYSFLSRNNYKYKIEFNKDVIFWVFSGLLLAYCIFKLILLVSFIQEDDSMEVFGSYLIITLISVIFDSLTELFIVMLGLIYAKKHEAEYTSDESYKFLQRPYKVRFIFIIASFISLFVIVHKINYQGDYYHQVNFIDNIIDLLDAFSIFLFSYWIIWLASRINRLYKYANKNSIAAEIIYWLTGIIGLVGFSFLLIENVAVWYTIIPSILASAICFINYEINYKIIAKAKKIDEPVIDETQIYYRR